MGSIRVKTAAKRQTAGRTGGGRRIALFVCLVLAAALAVAGGVAFKTMRNIGGEGGAQSVIETIRDPRAKFPADKNRVNILVYGKDYDYTNKGIRFTSGSGEGQGSRTDSIMMASLDLQTKKISLLSIPRDTRIEGPDGKIGKINAIYRNHGRDAFIKKVTAILGVAPDYYIGIKSDSVGKVVDTLGGVDVETIDAMKYDDKWAHLHIDLPKGPQHINGEQAIGFARFREVNKGAKSSKEESDPRRMARQQQLIRAMAKKATSGGNLFQLDHLVNVTLEQLETDLDRMQIFALAALFRTTDPETMVSGALQGHGEIRGGTYMVILDEKKKQATVDWLLKGDESAANRLTIVSVENATGVPGAARRVGDLLKKQGFDVTHTGNAAATPPPASAGANGKPPPPAEADATRIVYTKAAYAPRARRIAELLGGGNLEKSLAPDSSGVEGYEHELADVRIILGRDLAPKFSSQTAQR